MFLQVYCLLLLTTASVTPVLLQFVPPEAILQAGYPAGFRAFIPDFPGCEKFVFGGRLQSPLDDNVVNTFTAEVLRPVRGFWNFEDLGMALTPGDIMHYWTLVVKDKMPFPRHNLSWTVPEPDEAVDMLKPITLKPPTVKPPPKGKPSKMVDTEPTTAESTSSPTKAPTTAETNEGTSSTVAEEDKITLSLDGKIHPSLLEDEDSTPADESETPSSQDVLSRSGIADTASTDSNTESTGSDAPSATTTSTATSAKTTPEITTSQKPAEAESTPEATTSVKPTEETPKPSKPTKKSTTPEVTPAEAKSSPETITSEKPPEETPKPSKPAKKSTKPEVSNPLMEDIEELTTPSLPALPALPDKPLAGELPLEPPPLFPFPGLFPRPLPKPLLPTAGPSFEICSNPWNFEEQVGESRTQRLERQLARMQCELALHQRSQAQLANRVERELTDLKKLVFGMVSRMSRLESVLRSAAFG